ncbi:MAG: hypothetical protein OXU76_03710, partial [Alphaproteobacteria bacterium]|nr:hypothetical protein [Alphaproteobacteria bacterium]
MYRQLAILVFIPFLFLTACGGGGQGGSSAPNTPPAAQPDATLQQRNTQLENTNRELQTQIENLNADINRQTQTGRTLVTDLTRLVSQIREQTGGALPTAQAGGGGAGENDIDALLRQTRTQLTEIETRVATLQTLAGRINTQTGGDTNLNNGVNALIAQNQQLQQTRTALQQQRDSLEGEKSALQTQTASLQAQIQSLNAQLNPTPGNLGTVDPSRPYPYDTSFGTPSNLFAAHAALAANLRIYNQPFDPENLPLITRETQANLAWAQGWTGKGVKIGHLDTFYRYDEQDFTNFDPAAAEQLSHGEKVRAGYLFVAPEADYVQRQFNLHCGGNQANQKENGFEYFNTNGYHIVNNSYGYDRYNYETDAYCRIIPGTGRLLPDAEWNNVITLHFNSALFKKYASPVSAAGSFHRNMLFVWSAGNKGEGC